MQVCLRFEGVQAFLDGDPIWALPVQREESHDDVWLVIYAPKGGPVLTEEVSVARGDTPNSRHLIASARALGRYLNEVDGDYVPYAYAVDQLKLFCDGVRDVRLGDSAIVLLDGSR